VSATDVAVRMMVSVQFCELEVQLEPGSLVGSGTLFGAVKVTVVFTELAGMLPVSEVQLFLDDVVEVPEELTVVVVYWHIQVTFKLVEPLTVAVKVVD